MLTVPFNRPAFPPAAFDHMRGAISREYLAGDGHYTRMCEDWIESALGVERALLTTSCTSALEMALLMLDLEPGDEVILPSFTFVSCANAVVLRGATPVFADIDPVTLSLSVDTIRPRLTSRTRCVMTVHYGGVSRDIADVARLCEEEGVVLLEDAAHAFLGSFEGKPLGTFGRMAAFSFHETKNFSMGEGGALITSDPYFIERSEIIREKGTNRKQFFKGLVDKYSWVDVGSSFVPSDLLAALLWSQLEQADAIAADRQRAWEHYDEALAPWAAEHGVTTPYRAPGAAHHTYHLRLPSAPARDAMLPFMRERGVNGVFHYLPLEQSPFGLKFAQLPCPVSADVASTLVRLPLFPGISTEELDAVVSAVTAFVP